MDYTQSLSEFKNFQDIWYSYKINKSDKNKNSIFLKFEYYINN